MSNHITIEKGFVQLSEKAQEMLSGGQKNFKFGDPIEEIGALGRGTLRGAEDIGKATNTEGTTSAGPNGSLGNSTGKRSGTKTAARDLMILPPAFNLSQTGK